MILSNRRMPLGTRCGLFVQKACLILRKLAIFFAVLFVVSSFCNNLAGENRLLVAFFMLCPNVMSMLSFFDSYWWCHGLYCGE